MLLAEHRASLDPGRHGQVATDFRLYVLSEGAILRDILKQLIAAVVARAEAEIDVIMPGFTHLQARSAALRATLAPLRRPTHSATECVALQPAQPVRWSHFLLAHAWSWRRDVSRLDDLLKRADVMPLGRSELPRPAAVPSRGIPCDMVPVRRWLRYTLSTWDAMPGRAAKPSTLAGRRVQPVATWRAGLSTTCCNMMQHMQHTMLQRGTCGQRVQP